MTILFLVINFYCFLRYVTWSGNGQLTAEKLIDAVINVKLFTPHLYCPLFEYNIA